MVRESRGLSEPCSSLCPADRGCVVSPRVGRRELVRVAQAMSERDGQILRVVAELRIASAGQIEALVFTEGSALTRARRSRGALARLTEWGVVARLERRIGGVRAGSSSYLYRLAPAGRRLLGLPVRAGWREPGLDHLQHTLAAGDLHVALAQAAARGEIEGFEVEHEPGIWRRFTGLGGDRQWLKPDLFVTVISGDMEWIWFVEIDRGSESLRRIAAKADQYVAYWRTGQEQQRLGVFPKVAWIAPDEARATALQEALERAGEPAVALSTVTTTDRALHTLRQIDPVEAGGRS